MVKAMTRKNDPASRTAIKRAPGNAPGPLARENAANIQNENPRITYVQIGRNLLELDFIPHVSDQYDN
jgi:hypothetical protein